VLQKWFLLGQEDCAFETTLGYIVSSRPAWVTLRDLVTKNKKRSVFTSTDKEGKDALIYFCWSSFCWCDKIPEIGDPLIRKKDLFWLPVSEFSPSYMVPLLWVWKQVHHGGNVCQRSLSISSHLEIKQKGEGFRVLMSPSGHTSHDLTSFPTS
jgi:hypothetical protein